MYINSLNQYLKSRFGRKVYKLALSSGCSCPNRDGTLGISGCIFCDGAGAFAEKGPISLQLERGKRRIASKVGENPGYIPYFQSFTNTYAPAEKLRPMFLEAMEPDDVVALSIATRPDCLPGDIMELLRQLSRIKPVWVELGLQTIHSQTAELINRGYPLSVYDEAVEKLHDAGCEVITHQILGLPGEDKAMMADTSRYIGKIGSEGIKLHLLHVIRGTRLEGMWREGKVSEMDLYDYIDALMGCIRVLPRDVVIHRLTGDGDKKTLLAPLWSGDKKRVLNEINRVFRENDLTQGSLL